MHYEVEVRTKGGVWLSSGRSWSRLSDARLEAASLRKHEREARVVRVAKEGLRTPEHRPRLHSLADLEAMIAKAEALRGGFHINPRLA